MPFTEKPLTLPPPVEVDVPDLDAYLADRPTEGTTGDRS